MEEKTDKNQKEIRELNEERKKAQETAKSFRDATMVLEMDRASYVLRVLNVPEDKDTDLTDQMEEVLAELLEIDKIQMSKEIDQVYKVNSSFARRNKVPREVHIFFYCRRMKKAVLKKLRENPLKFWS